MKKFLTLMCSISLILTPYITYAVDDEIDNNNSNINEVNNEENKTNEESKEVTTGNENISSEDEEDNEETETEGEEEEQKIDYTLASITIEGGKLTKDFDSDTFEYELEIDDEELTNFNVVATPTFKSKKKSVGVIISKHDDYKTIKKNGITLVVSIDGSTDSTKTYKLKLKVEEKNTVLSSVKMIGYAFNEAFNSETFDYTSTIPNEVTAVTIETVLANKDDEIVVTKPSTSKVVKDNLNATITVSSLSIGGNKISFDVINGDIKSTYTIYVTRSDEDDLEEQETSIIDSLLTENGESVISNDLAKTITSSSSINAREDTNPDSIVSIIVVCFGCLVLLGIGGIGIYFFIKTSPKRMKKEIIKENSEIISSPMIEVNKEEEKENKIKLNDDNDDVI